MTTYAALLRGINVGGHRKVPMAELRRLIEGLGHGDVRTHLQSGNAVFSVAGRNAAGVTTESRTDALAASLGRAVEEHFGFTVPVLVRDHSYLRAVVEDCPFPTAGLEGRQLHVTYLSEPVEAARFAALDRSTFLPDEFRIGDRALYLYVPDGLGRSRLAEALGRPALWRDTVATSRNWNTVIRLVEMTRG
ncbi:DUF1697 domain-containing protein [Streptomyces sp. NPDC059816]|uniref:DUF1697 domain-containing protein n=1 Tax=Streptomyces sp. NPDC059816 TaxID=3346960 RepID=UPI003647961F